MVLTLAEVRGGDRRLAAAGANFLNVIGLPWPYVNEDTVTQFASLLREFRQAVQTTHQDAIEAVAAIAKAHQSVSTEAMQSGWAKLSASYDEITQQMTDAGDGARGVVWGTRVREIAGKLLPVPGHVFNVTNIGGRI